jgi:hypothetical protein
MTYGLKDIKNVNFFLFLFCYDIFLTCFDEYIYILINRALLKYYTKKMSTRIIPIHHGL